MPLDPEIAAYLESQKLLPPRSSLTLGQTRQRMVEAAARYGGEPVDLPLVRDFTVAAVPVREYRAAEGPIIVYFHGGRFISGGLDSHDRVCRRLARAAQCRVVSVDYRLAPENRFPAAVEDSLAVVDWAIAESPKPVAVAGDSAGANLAAVAASGRRTGIACQVLVYPMIDATCSQPSHVKFGEGWGPSSKDMRRGWHDYMPSGTDPHDARLSPFFATDLGGLPPALVLTAEYDCLRDEGEGYATRMQQAGNEVRLKRYAGAIHGFITLTGAVAMARQAIDEAGEFICSRG